MCVHSDCGRTLDLVWKFPDGEDGYICTATHEKLGNDVAFYKYHLVDDKWVLKERLRWQEREL